MGVCTDRGAEFGVGEGRGATGDCGGSPMGGREGEVLEVDEIEGEEELRAIAGR